jgi:hypothetical protein
MATERFILDSTGSPIRRVMQYNPHETNSRQGGQIVFRSGQDVDAIIAANRRDRDIDQRKRNFRHVARIPAVVWEMMVREGWWNDDAKVQKWLDDNPAFKIEGGW